MDKLSLLDSQVSCWPSCKLYFLLASFRSYSQTGKVVVLTPGAGTFANFALKKLTFSKKLVIPSLVGCKGKNLEHLVNLLKKGKHKTVMTRNFL